jgi:hypothetical protein
MGRPKKIDNARRVIIYLDEKSLVRVDEVAGFYGEHRQDTIRRAIGEFLERNGELSVYKCPNCDFLLKINRMDEPTKRFIKDHERDCKARKNVKGGK